MSETRNESVDERRGTNRREVTDKRNDAENERRNADRRAMERQPVVESAQPQANRTDAEQMRTNPEVMGRTEPVEMDRSGFQGRPAQQAHVEQMDFWPEMHQFRERLNEIQSQFIDEPREPVKKAERLIEEAVDHMAKSMHEHVKRMHSDVEGNADTEKLRLVMRSYRAFIEKLDNRRAA
ncbi:MAG: hypothetical protein E6J46_09095 [Chloroflexi bacterium]|nr:MAG: hypothetical protein E6J46_09095 [Chloroflexota bacterium]